MLGRRRGPATTGGARGGVDARREAAEDRIEVRDDPVLAADHEAVAALEAEDAAARADVDVVHPARLELGGAVDVVAVVAVAAVDDDVAALEVPGELASPCRPRSRRAP